VGVLEQMCPSYFGPNPVMGFGDDDDDDDDDNDVLLGFIT